MDETADMLYDRKQRGIRPLIPSVPAFMERRFMHTFLFPQGISSRLLPGLLLGGLALGPQAAQAQVTAYTSASAFQAASLNATAPFHFDSLTTPGNTHYYGPSYSFDGVSFTSSSLKVLSPTSGEGDLFGGHSFLVGLKTANSGRTNQISWGAPTGTTAFGATFASLDGSPITVTVNDQLFTLGTGNTFFGFTSSAPITFMAVDSASTRGTAMDGIVFGDAAPVPEASSVISLGLLLVCAGGAALVRRRRAAPRLD